MAKQDTKTKAKISILELVYPPVSNQEMILFQDQLGVEERLRQSDFYMIGARKEATYQNISNVPDTFDITLDFVIGDDFHDAVRLSVLDLPNVKASGLTTVSVSAGPKIVQVWSKDPEDEGAALLEWFTTEKLIWDRAHGMSGIGGFDRFREASNYDLLYVGIAKVGDSYDRLIAKGHKARMDILGNEPQRQQGARVTDEVYLFLFKIEPIFIATYEPDHEFDDSDFDPDYQQKLIVADAEKAYVSMMKPGYNVQLFKNYPKGADGLYDTGLARYGYAIGECLKFRTSNGTITGSRNPVTGMIDNNADAIFVDGDVVRFFKSGIDFPGEADSSTKIHE